METDFSPQLFVAGQEIATFLVSCGILSKAWEESRAASGSESFIVNEYEGVGYVAFPSFCNLERYIVEENGYGECNIQTDNWVFSACLKGNSDQPGLVHQGALKLFLHILENTDFQAQLQIYTESKLKRLKPIVFVGHSLGGAVATLATLWILEKRLRQSSPLCITFGCPLVGDINLVEAIGRENWGGNFCHVVSKNDIVPRMLFAPFESTAKVNPNLESPLEMGILLQLEALGVGAQDENAERALRRAAETEHERNRNVERLAIDLSQRQCNMAELEWYKEVCEKRQGETYYDSFKNHNERDIKADTRRVKLAEFWDDIIEKVKSQKLPSDFQTQNKWINAGTAYRRLVEPLDIAYYYRLLNVNGNYLSDERKDRHKVLQKWMEEKEKTRSLRAPRPRTKAASLTEDSCFWAYVEDSVKDLNNLKNGQHQKLQCLEKFEKDVTTMVNSLSISSDVFLPGTSFMMWWEEWKEYNKKRSPEWSSPLYEILESEIWKRRIGMVPE